MLNEKKAGDSRRPAFSSVQHSSFSIQHFFLILPCDGARSFA